MVFEFSGSWVYDGAAEGEDMARYLRQKYGEDVLKFLKDWGLEDQIDITVDGERVFG